MIRRPAATVDQSVAVIAAHRFHHATEKELQEGLAEALTGQTQPSVSYCLVSDVGSDPVVADVLNLKSGGVNGCVITAVRCRTECRRNCGERWRVVA